MADTVVYKMDHDTRIKATARSGGIPIALAGRTIEVKLAAANAVVTLAIGTGVTIEGAPGTFSYLWTPAHYATLANPAEVNTTVNIWNADNTLELTAEAVMHVEL